MSFPAQPQRGGKNAAAILIGERPKYLAIMSAVGVPRDVRKGGDDSQHRQQQPAGEAVTEAGPPYSVAFSGPWKVPPQLNEPVLSYAPGSPERKTLKAKLKEMSGERIEIPLVIGGK